MPNIMKSLRTVKRPAPLTMCPCGPDGISFATHWYRLPGVESFFICTKCYEEKLANTQFAGLFDNFYNEPLPGSNSICDFNSLRMDQILSHAVRTGSTEKLFAFAEHRSSISPCHGTNGTLGGRGIRWFNIPEIPGFIACEACYEDSILATSFASSFSPSDEQPVEEKWICDLAVPYIKRSLVQYAKRSDWHGFVNAVNYRLAISSCEDKPVLLSVRKWFRPMHPWVIEKMMICEACYLDHAASLPPAFFTRVHPKYSEMQTMTLCSFRSKPIQAYSEQLLKYNYARWHHLVNQIVTKPSCAKGEIEGEWYTLPDPKHTFRNIADFDICGACYLGYVEATGNASAFRKVTHSSGATRICDFSPVTPRYTKFMQQWSQMVFTGDSTSLADYASRITKLTPCARSKDVFKARWWGMDDVLFCAECYEEVGKGSYFAQTLHYKGELMPVARCDMYTDNMRRRYLEACTERSLDEFLNYCHYREEIWQLMRQEMRRHKATIKLTERANSQSKLLTSSRHVEPSTAIVSTRPELGRIRRVSAPAKIFLDHRITEENLKRAQRKAVMESIQMSPTLLHLQTRWNEVE